MKQLALIEYTMMFDPGVTGWSHLYMFEKSLTEFFESKGLDAMVIKGIEGGDTKRILYLRPKEMKMPTPPQPVGRPKSIKGIIKTMSNKNVKAKERDFKKGKFLSRKGYLKK